MSNVKTISPFSALRKGSIEKLSTTFNGQPAPGGNYYQATRHYVKMVKKSHFQQYQGGYGVDYGIVADLKNKECRTLEIEVSDEGEGGRSYCVPFSLFLERAKLLHYKDPRFPQGGRYYLSLMHFATDLEALQFMLDKAGEPSGEAA